MPAHSYLRYLWNLVSIAVSFTVAPALAAYTSRLMPILRALFPIPLPVSVFKDTRNISFIAFFVFCSVIIPSLTTRIHYILIQTINFSLFLPYSTYTVHLQGKMLESSKTILSNTFSEVRRVSRVVAVSQPSQLVSSFRF